MFIASVSLVITARFTLLRRPFQFSRNLLETGLYRDQDEPPQQQQQQVRLEDCRCLLACFFCSSFLVLLLLCLPLLPLMVKGSGDNAYVAERPGSSDPLNSYRTNNG